MEKLIFEILRYGLFTEHMRSRYMGYRPSLFSQDGWILASFFFCVFKNRDGVNWSHKHAKKNEANIQPS